MALKGSQAKIVRLSLSASHEQLSCTAELQAFGQPRAVRQRPPRGNADIVLAGAKGCRPPGVGIGGPGVEAGRFWGHGRGSAPAAEEASTGVRLTAAMGRRRPAAWPIELRDRSRWSWTAGQPPVGKTRTRPVAVFVCKPKLPSTLEVTGAAAAGRARRSNVRVDLLDRPQLTADHPGMPFRAGSTSQLLMSRTNAHTSPVLGRT